MNIAEVKKKLEKSYCTNKIPTFLKRINPKEISSQPCFNCLRETELAVNKGYWKDFPKPIYYWYEMCNAESKEIKEFIKNNKPKKILEVGCGSGRIINILLSIDYPKEIFAVEKNKLMAQVVKPFFNKYSNVYIINKDVKDFLTENGNFDLSVCMMNTFGNINNLELLSLIAKHSKHLIFSVYDEKYYRLREKIYLSKGHKKFIIENKTYYFNDCWVKGLKSKSYSQKELETICKSLGKKFKIKKISKLLFLVHVCN